MGALASVAVSRELGERLKSFAKDKGTTVSGAVEVICRVFLDSEGEGNEMEFPSPKPRGRRKGSVNKPKAMPEPLPADEAADVPSDEEIDAEDYGESEASDE